MSDPGRENNRQLVTIKLVLLQNWVLRKKWYYFRIKIRSRILQHRFSFLTKSGAIAFSFPFRDENVGHSDNVSIHYTLSFNLLFFLSCPSTVLFYF